MKVKISCLRSKGRDTHTDESLSVPRTTGALCIAEARNLDLQRSTVQARLRDANTENGPDLLPALNDVRILSAAKGKMRLCGMEYVDNVAYFQTWSVEVLNA
jgi:hypothetical protein